MNTDQKAEREQWIREEAERKYPDPFDWWRDNERKVREEQRSAYISGYAAALSSEPAQGQWISVDDSLPEVNNEDDWDRKAKISKRVWTYGEFGMRIGTCIRILSDETMWNIEGVTSSNGVKVSHWQPLPAPPSQFNQPAQAKEPKEEGGWRNLFYREKEVSSNLLRENIAPLQQRIAELEAHNHNLRERFDEDAREILRLESENQQLRQGEREAQIFNYCPSDGNKLTEECYCDKCRMYYGLVDGVLMCGIIGPILSEGRTVSEQQPSTD